MLGQITFLFATIALYFLNESAGDLNTSEYFFNWFMYSFVFEREKTYEHDLNISWIMI